MRIRRIGVAAWLLLLAVGGARAQQEERPSTPYIEVTGTGEVSETPDVAWVQAGIDVTAATAEAAQREANTIARRIHAALRQIGIPAEQIQTTRASLSPVYHRPRPDAPSVIVRYQAVNTVRIEIRDLDQVGAVIDAATRAGANRISGPNFGLRDDLPARLRALREAARAAQQKAETLAAALDRRLEGPIYVREGAWVVPFADAAAAFGGARREVATPIEPGRVEIHASVTVRYAIREGPRSGR